ncbi:hypothetical protein K2X33_00450, partial [bacterium]|nr:hypothetical protein [bacterium]
SSDLSYARMGNAEALEALVEETMSRAVAPTVLATIGNAYLLLGELDSADALYERLAAQPGWENRADFYRSQFCYQNGLFEEALSSALIARAAKPEDAAVAYHLSLCFDALGKKQEAWESIEVLELEGLDWLRFYRFQLERDLGKTAEAVHTLRGISLEFFEEPADYDAALAFARESQDFDLMRHLRKKNSR